MTIVALPPTQLREIAPNWFAMRTAIATCERIDEIKELADKAVALRAYFAQSQDIDNEVAAMRVRLRAERRLGELIKAEQNAGRLAKPGETRQAGRISTPTTFAELGIPRDRSARAQQLAAVPPEQFEAALQTGKPSASAIVKAARPAPEESTVDVEQVLKTWGAIRDFAAALNDGTMLPAKGWKVHPCIQPFQIAEICAAIPAIVSYLNKLAEE